jgi:hypothetical protein
MGRTALMGLLDSLKSPDRSFYSIASHPFDFTDVTALIRK